MKLFEISPANPVAREIACWARKYLRRYRGFSYDFRAGGEERVLRHLAPLGFTTLFDVGANTGGWAARAAAFFPEATIHTFELSRENFQLLKKHLPGRAFRHRSFGLADRAARQTYLDYGRGANINTLIQRCRFHDRVHRRRVKTSILKTGDGYCQTEGIKQVDYLKIDVEGAEHLVLQGFQGMLRRKAIRVVQFAYGYVNGDVGFLMRDFFELFDLHGYAVAPVRNRPLQFLPFDYAMNDFDSGPNYLAVRRDDREVQLALETP